MPWEHCGQQVMDDGECPECGASKGTWTLRQDVTRTFILSGPEDPADEDQADALEDAADSGSPFCEDCQAQDNEQAPAEEPTEPASNPDEDAQVETLENAAESGAPFCEECQKQDNAA